MPLAKVLSCAVAGLEGEIVEVEVDIASGMPAFAIVGLPDAAVQEAKERVRSAIRNSGFPFPNRRITVNLAPADLRKEGPAYDACEDTRCPITVVYNLQHRAMLELLAAHGKSRWHRNWSGRSLRGAPP